MPGRPMPAAPLARRMLEGTLRGLALGALAAMTVLTLRADRAHPEEAAAGEIDEALVRWSTQASPAAVHVTFDQPPSPRTRDWLAALRGAGTQVRWSGEAPAPTALAVDPVADPQRPLALWIAAPQGARVTLHDRLGWIGDVDVAGTGGRILVPHLEGEARAEIRRGDTEDRRGDTQEADDSQSLATAPNTARTATLAGPTIATTTAPTIATASAYDSLELRPVLVLGEASWEAKFALAALEEHGWTVHARLAVGEASDVRQGPAALRIDTATYAAVVALDTVAGRHAAALRRYVEAGGGLLVMGRAAATPGLRAVLPASATGPTRAAEPFVADTAARPREFLALSPLRGLAPDAVVIEHSGEDVAAAARRVGNGRVLQVGYHDSWRWRMAAAEDDAVDAHRAWWAALVSGVAYAPRHELAAPITAEPTPLATLVDALGPRAAHQPPDARQVDARWIDDSRLIPWLLALFFSALLMEWASRRLRGAR